MDYKAKLNASQAKAHLQNIATKIDRDMSKLRSQADESPTARRRWIWELIQNAKDVHNNGGVRIQVDWDDFLEYLEFRHTGKPFSADNIRFLIEQISTKDRTMDSSGLPTATGRFGTGFLTTHLLSERVTVMGVAKEPELDYKRFQFELDRTGYELDAISTAVERAKQSVENLDDLPVYADYDPDAFNTVFRYSINDALGQRVAGDGLADVDRCLPYALVFVPEIRGVEISADGRSYERIKDAAVGSKTFPQVSINDRVLGHTVLKMVTEEESFTSISLPVEIADGQISILGLSDQIPRLFCAFPLVGTECFPFPAVINDPHFTPTEPRDGVFLTIGVRPSPVAERNCEIVLRAVNLLIRLLNRAVTDGWDGLHHFANIRPFRDPPTWASGKWFSQHVILPVRNALLRVPIVNTAAQGRVSILDEEGRKYVLFPAGSTEDVRARIWSLATDWFPERLPKQDEVELWYHLLWEECGTLTLKDLARLVEGAGSVLKLVELMPQINCIEWLNRFYEAVDLDDRNRDAIVHHNAIFPNQLGALRTIASLYNDAGDIGDEFKDILRLLGSDVRDMLALPEMHFKVEERSIDRKFVVNQITQLATEKSCDRDRASEYREAFTALIKWFRENPVSAQELFPLLYSRRHLLYDDEFIVESMDKAEQLKELLAEAGVDHVAGLRLLLSKHPNATAAIVEVTQDILASLGITSLEDWEEAFKDQDLAAMFSHESTPTKAMFLYVQSLIERAKASVIAHLRTLRDYDVVNVESTAPTILGSVLKDGREIQIVVRPAYNGEVIIYYEAERDVLDYEYSELWADTSTKPTCVTLGHILKKTGIVKFPI
ncbi:MAG TPA: hypothetical protein PLY87_10685 [Planctomycetaceae bacterium]|nr:hypothetical protein [Planctomycetaceae bacterium]